MLPERSDHHCSEETVPRSCPGLSSYRLETSTRASVPLPAARPPFLCWSVAGGPGSQARIPIIAAIVPEPVNSLGVISMRVVSVRVTAAVVTVTIAGDDVPVRPGRSQAGGRTGSGSRPTDRLGVTGGRGGGPVPTQIAVALGIESNARGGRGGRRRWPARCRPSDRPGWWAVPLEQNPAGAAGKRAGHDGPTARAGRTPALRGGRG